MIPDWEAILLVNHAAEGDQLYRTQLQKILYFASQKDLLQDSFVRGYYGPFSSKIAKTIEGMVEGNFLNESIFFDSGTVGYKYRLAGDGKEIIRILVEKNSKEFEELIKIVEICKNQSSMFLSIAAKVHFILKKMETSMSSKEVVNKAKLLDWNIKEDEVIAVSRLLSELGF